MKQELPRGYIFLCCVVGFMFILVMMSFMVYNIGYGRWECVESTEKETITCPIGTNISDPVDLLYNCEIQKNEECIKEVWTHK